MAILVQSNKKPNLTFPTLTGDIVNFNSQYAGLPLKSCKVNIPVTQEGIGNPSPDNVRNFVGIDSLDFSANSVVRTFQFGQTIYTGELDVLTGIFTATHGVVDLGSITWVYVGDGLFRTPIISNMKTGYLPDWRCEVYSVTTAIDYAGWGNKPNNTIGFLSTYSHIIVKDDRYTDGNDLKTALNGMKLVYELATPEVINLGGMNIETLQGENNLFASTGDTTASFIKIGG